VTDQTSEVMRVLNRLIACDLAGLSEDELVVLGQLAKDIRPLRNQVVRMLQQRGLSFHQMARLWDVDPATTMRWADEPTARRPGQTRSRPQ
jgi:hypothetical protein